MGVDDTAFRRASSAKPRLLSWWEIMPWQRDNEFILSGYRPASYCCAEALKSIFQLHNETVNIWTHLIASAWFLAHGTAFFLGLLSPSLPLPLPGRDGDNDNDNDNGGGGGAGDGLAVALYYGTTATCFGLSALFHTVADHSPGLHAAGHALDHLGIVAGLWGAGASTAHFALACAPAAVRAAHQLLLGGLAAAAAAATLRRNRNRNRNRDHDPRRRAARLLLYAGLGAALFAPLAHAAWRAAYDEADDGGDYAPAAAWTTTTTTTTTTTMARTAAAVARRLDDQAGLRSFLVLAAVQLTGGALYAARVPERWAPRAFDRFGQSHQIMHALVVVGARVRLDGLLAAARYWRARDGSCSRPL